MTPRSGSLSPPEQAEVFLYHHRLSGAQTHTYLAQASAAERTAYLRTLGVVQRFQALDPLDQEAVRSGWPRVGMSAEALLFVWGEPYYTAGDARQSAHWHWLLLDSRVVDLPMAYNPTFVILSSLKPLFFNSLKNELRFLDNAGA